MGEDLLCFLEAALVLFVESLTVLEFSQDDTPLLIPDLVVAALCDVGSTCRDHLIGHFHKECRHPLRGVVVARVTVDHSDSIN